MSDTAPTLPPPDKPADTKSPLYKGGITNLVGHRVSIEDIDAALAKFDNCRPKAAKFLDLTTARLNAAVAQNKWLKSRWRKYQLVGPSTAVAAKGMVATPLPNEITTIARDPLVPLGPNEPPVLQSEADLAAQMEKEDAKVKDGLTIMGCTPQEADLAVSLRNFHGRHIERTLHMMTAGLSLNTLRMLGVLRKLEQKLEKDEFKRNEKGDPKEEALIRDSYRALLEEYRKTTELCLKGSYISAKIEAMKRAAQKGKSNSRPKPGFRPKGDTNVIAQNVILQP